jgi:hypothetical protein
LRSRRGSRGFTIRGMPAFAVEASSIAVSHVGMACRCRLGKIELRIGEARSERESIPGVYGRSRAAPYEHLLSAAGRSRAQPCRAPSHSSTEGRCRRPYGGPWLPLANLVRTRVRFRSRSLPSRHGRRCCRPLYSCRNRVPTSLQQFPLPVRLEGPSGRSVCVPRT